MLKKVIGINTSGREGFNTTKLVKEALRGAADAGCKTEYISLVNLNMIPCHGCFTCHRNTNPHHNCVIEDDLTPIIEKLKKSDGIIFGTPIYFYKDSARMKILTERFLFPLLNYNNPAIKYPKKIQIGLIYSVGGNEQIAKRIKLEEESKHTQIGYELIFGKTVKYLWCHNTLHVKDLSKYQMKFINDPAKLSSKKKQFPISLQNAYDFGKNLIQ